MCMPCWLGNAVLKKQVVYDFEILYGNLDSQKGYPLKSLTTALRLSMTAENTLRRDAAVCKCD